MCGEQRLAIHGKGEQHLWSHRLGKRDRAAKAELMIVARDLVEPGERDVARLIHDAGRHQDIPQRDTAPPAIADRLGAPEQFARHRPMRHQFITTESGAGQCRGDIAPQELLLQLAEREVQWSPDQPANVQPL